MPAPLQFYRLDHKWFMLIEGVPKRITFQLALPGIELDGVDVPYNDCFGEDKEYDLNYRLSIGADEYLISVHEEFLWRSNKRLDTSVIGSISLNNESVSELVVPYDHPAMSCFKVVGDDGEI